MTDTQDVLIYLDPKDLVGRGARKRKGSTYTRDSVLCVNVWTADKALEEVQVGEVEYTVSASASYLWHRRDLVDEVIARSRASMATQ